MKRLLAAILTVALVAALLFCMPLTAQASPSLSMQISVSPTSLVTGGSVELQVNVSNSGDEEAQNVAVTYSGSTLAELGNIAAGDSKSYTEPNFSVPTDSLGKGMKIVVTYEYGDQQKSISQTVTVAKKQANVSVNTSVKVDKTTVAAGGQVNFTFAIENQGDVTIDNAVLKASALNGGKALADSFSLSAGNVKMINYTATVYKDIKVSPVLTFSVAGDSKSVNLETTNITVSEAGLSVSATADKATLAAGEQVSFTIQLANTGNVDLKNLTLTDNSNNRVSLPQNTLAAGSNLSATYTMTPTENVTVSFALTAEDSTGQTYTFQSNTTDLAVTAAPSASPTVDPNSALTMTVKVDPMKLDAAGTVTFSLIIKNNTTDTFSNVKISERSLGELYTVEQLPPGEVSYETKVDLSQTVECLLTVEGTAADGTAVKISSDPITITVGGETAEGPNWLLIIIIVVIVLIVGVIVVLLVLMNKEKKRKALAAQQEQMRSSRVAMRQDSRVPPAAEARHIQPTPGQHAAETDLYDDEPQQTRRAPEQSYGRREDYGEVYAPRDDRERRNAEDRRRMDYDDRDYDDADYDDLRDDRRADPQREQYGRPQQNKQSTRQRSYAPTAEPDYAPRENAYEPQEKREAPRTQPRKRTKHMDFEDRNQF